MSETLNTGLDWGDRFRAQIKEKGLSLADVAAKMTRPGAENPLAESTLRSWTNGTRKINLADFLWLCEAAGVDPATVLFGRSIMSDVQRKALGELAASLTEKAPPSSARAHARRHLDSRRKAHTAAPDAANGSTK